MDSMERLLHKLPEDRGHSLLLGGRYRRLGECRLYISRGRQEIAGSVSFKNSPKIGATPFFALRERGNVSFIDPDAVKG